MTRNRWEQDPDAVREAERFYKFVGEYVICFQWLEGQIDQIFLLARGDDNRDDTFSWLAQRTNEQKVNAFHELINSGAPFRDVPVSDWAERLQSVIDRLHGERRRRNGILHAQFLFDFLAIGAPVIRSHVRRQGGNPVFDRESLSPERCQQIMQELADLAVDLSMICVQLRHVYRLLHSD